MDSNKRSKGTFVFLGELFEEVVYSPRFFRFLVQAEGTASPLNSTSPGFNGANVRNADQAKTELSRTQSKVWKPLPFPFPPTPCNFAPFCCPRTVLHLSSIHSFPSMLFVRFCGNFHCYSVRLLGPFSHARFQRFRSPFCASIRSF